MKRLFIITSAYPFGTKESFLETEIPYHAQRFDKVVIVPLNSSGPARPLPENCDIDLSLRCSKPVKVIKCLYGMWMVLPMFLRCLPKLRSNNYHIKIKRWFKTLLISSFYRQSKFVNEILKNGTSKDVVYSYWGVEYNSFFPFLNGKVHLVSRFHGDWDLWEESYYGYVPLRFQIAKALDTAVFIARKGEEYFKKKYPFCRTKVFPLGTNDCGLAAKSSDGTLRIVSCSRVYPLKRIPLIFDALRNIPDKKIEWYHIGDGPTFEEIRHSIKLKTYKNLKVFLLGYMSHNEVMDFYKTHPFDIFINLSTNEGVPVSIMEAISFDIPVVATNVGCTNEVVTNETGVLIDSNPSIKEIVDAILSVSKKEFSPRIFWITHYNAEENYSLFSDYIYSLAN